MITDQQKLGCAERSILIWWILRGVLSEIEPEGQQVTTQIATMEAIADDYRAKIGLAERNARHARRGGKRA